MRTTSQAGNVRNAKTRKLPINTASISSFLYLSQQSRLLSATTYAVSIVDVCLPAIMLRRSGGGISYTSSADLTKSVHALGVALSPFSRAFGNGLGWVIARRLAWALIRYAVLHPKRAGALMRSASEMVITLIHDIEGVCPWLTSATGIN